MSDKSHCSDSLLTLCVWFIVHFPFEMVRRSGSKIHREFNLAHNPFGNASDACWTSVSGSSSACNSDIHITSIPLPITDNLPAKKPCTSTHNDISQESSSLEAEPSNTDEAKPCPASGPSHKTNSKPNVRDFILRHSLYSIQLQGISNLMARMLS